MNGGTLKLILSATSYAAMIGGLIWQWRRVRSARRWPETEATVESGEFGSAVRVGFSSVKLPVFAFSYQVSGQHYRGRFSLLPYSYDLGDSILKLVIGRKLRLNYDPRRPEQWFLPDSLIEGYKVEQKIGVMNQRFAPKD